MVTDLAGAPPDQGPTSDIEPSLASPVARLLSHGSACVLDLLCPRCSDTDEVQWRQPVLHDLVLYSRQAHPCRRAPNRDPEVGTHPFRQLLVISLLERVVRPL